MLDPILTGDQQIITNNLYTITDGACEGDPSAFVVVGHRVLDRRNRVAIDPADEEFGKFITVEFTAFKPKPITPTAAKLRGRYIERKDKMIARNETGTLDRAHKGL